MTDIVTLFLSFFFLLRGASRGFINSLLVPFSIIAATVISIIYYELTNNVIITLLIGLIGPLILHIFFKIAIKVLAPSYFETKPGFLSRLGGAILTLIWGWVFIIFALILLAVMPPWGKTLTAVHDDVVKSAAYCMVKPIGESLFASASKQNGPAAAPAAAGDNETKALADDPRFQEVLKDPDIQKAINDHDMVKLMSNPKMMDLTKQIMSDPATMKKVLAIYSKQPNPHAFVLPPDPSKPGN